MPSVVFTHKASQVTGWTTIMTINFIASVVSLTFAILGKVIERKAAKGEATVLASQKAHGSMSKIPLAP